MTAVATQLTGLAREVGELAATERERIAAIGRAHVEHVAEALDTAPALLAAVAARGRRFLDPPHPPRQDYRHAEYRPRFDAAPPLPPPAALEDSSARLQRVVPAAAPAGTELVGVADVAVPRGH